MTEPRNAEYRTIVVGAGPAGIMAALRASQAGSVLLVDASALPRDKSCGGMLNEYAQSFLGRIAEVPGNLFVEPEHVHFRYWDWDRNIKKPTALRFHNVDRRRFDEWLLSLLPPNVEVAGSTAVEGITQDDAGVTVRLRNGVTESVRAEYVVGCDGARSHVRRSLGVGSAATYVTLQDFVRLHGHVEPFFDCIYMRGIGDCYAYSYVVPKGDVAIVGSVYYPKTVRPHEKQNCTLETLRLALPQLGETVKREASTALYVRKASDVVPGMGRVLLAGEAGGFMSPTSGEGISYALNTGMLAGTAVALSGNGEAADAYARVTSRIGANIARKLGWLPLMESGWGKYLAGFVPTGVVSRITKGL